jgi:hypothetical protein
MTEADVAGGGLARSSLVAEITSALALGHLSYFLRSGGRQMVWCIIHVADPPLRMARVSALDLKTLAEIRRYFFFGY